MRPIHFSENAFLSVQTVDFLHFSEVFYLSSALHFSARLFILIAHISRNHKHFVYMQLNDSKRVMLKAVERL